jgi:hypothetical protein
VLLCIRASSTSHQLATAKLHNFGRAVDHFTGGV